MTDSLIVCVVAMGICLYQANSRKRAGLPLYACALGFMAALSVTFEFNGHIGAARVAALIYAALYIKSQAIMVRHDL